MYDYEDEPSCPGSCGRNDHGWNTSDTRLTRTIAGCRCLDQCVCTDEERADYTPDAFDGCMCEDNGCGCDNDTTIKVVIQRIWDKTCDYCEGSDYRCAFSVLLDGASIKQFASQADADSYVERVFPTAVVPERDYAWESEAGLRRAEGWG
jgi:hypothetical protein